ncbi:MAG: enoyl-CoA hydratase/isomerase family protein [Rubripirellula sp.]|nr:enoyl-CoA hydratase/isomerase family protein [Rubripirellula sp.]
MQYVDVKVHANVATILMDRPKTRNALNPQLIEDLTTAFSDVYQEKRVASVVLTGGGEHFCSGIDLKVMSEIAQMPESSALPEWWAVWRNLTELYESMLRFPKPIVAAVDGSALGAGLGLALAADLIVASKRATFGAIAVRRGLVGGATAALLSFRLGGATAARMVLTGQMVTAIQASRWGLCDEPVDPKQIWVAANELASQCAAAPQEAMQATKRLLNEGVGELLLSQLSAGAAGSATACTTEAAREGIQSYLDNREPIWPK